MGILRKYLWLVVPIVFFANYASADTCENDPYTCTPTELCSKTTEKIDNVLYWISSEEDKHLKAARKINLNCGAKDAMSSCQKDASECSILELCKVAATKDVSATNWNEINPQHVKLAKSFGLDCGVKEVQGINQVNKTNTFKSTSNDKTCSQDVMKCTPTELCDAASYTVNGITGWKVGAYKKYVDEAKRRNISCGVKVDIEDVKIAKLIKIFYVANNSCRGDSADRISTWEKCVERTKTSQALQSYGFCYGKASDDGAYKHRWHDCDEASYRVDKKQYEKSLIEYQNNIEEIIDRLALKTEKKRKADEKARIALEAEKRDKNTLWLQKNCNKNHDILALKARELFGVKNISKDNWADCVLQTLIFKSFRTGAIKAGIRFERNADFTGFVYSQDHRNVLYFNGGVICYDVGLNVLKRGRGRGCR